MKGCLLGSNWPALVQAGLHWRNSRGGQEAAVGFTEIRLSFDLVSPASDEELATLQRLTERYCVVFQTLAGSPGLTVSLNSA